MCLYYIYSHRVFLQPACLLSPDVVYFILSPPFLPNACLFSLHGVVIVASIFLAPSLTLRFEMLHMLYFTMRCICFAPEVYQFCPVSQKGK